MNRTPTASIHDLTPKERFIGIKSDVSHLKVFGCIAYVHIPDELRTKLDPKAEKCIFIGYSLEQKGYRCVTYLRFTSDIGICLIVLNKLMYLSYIYVINLLNGIRYQLFEHIMILLLRDMRRFIEYSQF